MNGVLEIGIPAHACSQGGSVEHLAFPLQFNALSCGAGLVHNSCLLTARRDCPLRSAASSCRPSADTALLRLPLWLPLPWPALTLRYKKQLHALPARGEGTWLVQEGERGGALGVEGVTAATNECETPHILCGHGRCSSASSCF